MLVLVLWLQNPILAWSFHNGPRMVGQLQSSSSLDSTETCEEQHRRLSLATSGSDGHLCLGGH